MTVRHIRLGPAQQLARIMQEQRSGQFLADVVYNNLLHLIYLKESGVLGKYESPENRFLMKEAIDSDGYWVGGDIDVLVTGFNTKMIARNEVPTTYDRFLDGKLKEQMAINSNNPYALVGMASLRGEDQGIAYMKKLAQQNLRPVQGFTHMANLLAAGEYPIALFSQVTKIEEMKEKGAPVDWVPNSPNFSTVGAYGLSRNPPHPAGARLLVDFVLSDQGKESWAAPASCPCAGACRLIPRASTSCWRTATCTRLKPQRDSRNSEDLSRVDRATITAGYSSARSKRMPSGSDVWCVPIRHACRFFKRIDPSRPTSIFLGTAAGEWEAI